ncbi:uncharacterized protein [Haliotis asinina]|uniref:uncharacterized protein n=1 Tax=Haliotis asinina TaxID=109174 RepID=UPI003531A098
MSAYQGYPQGQGPGGYDEGRSWAALGNLPDGQYSQTEAYPPMTSKTLSVPMCQVVPGGGETYKQPAEYSGEDFTDEGKAGAPGNPPDGQNGKTDTDPLMTSTAQSASMTRVIPGGDDTFKQLAPYSGKEFNGVSRRKRTRFDTGGLPLGGQGQNADLRCSTHGGNVRGCARPTIPATPIVPTRPAIPARPTYPVPQKVEPPNRQLRISGLAVKTPGYKLMSYFSTWGVVEDFEVVKDLTLRSTGVAFVMFKNLGDAVKAVSYQPHVIDNKEVEVTYAKPYKKLPSETFSSRREQRHHETAQQQRLPESIQSLDQGYDISEAREPQKLTEDAQPKRQSTPDTLMSRLTQADSFEDMPFGTEYECNVSGCLFKGKPEQFERHWTKIHEAKVLYLICSFCGMECDADDLHQHLSFFHGIEDRSEMATLLCCAKQQERDNIHFVMPGSVTRETCMKVTNPPQNRDAKDVLSCTQCIFTGTVDEFVNHWEKHHSAGLSYLTCPKCPKTFKKRDFLLLHIKYQHQNKAVRTEKEPENNEKNFNESPNFNLLERVCHELQRQQLPISEMDIPAISGIGSIGAGNMPTMTLASLSGPLKSDQNVPLPVLPSQQPTPPAPPLLASQVPTQQAVSLQEQVTSFYPSTASLPKPVPPPLTSPPHLTSPPFPQPVPPPAIGSQSYPEAPLPWFSNTSTRQPVVAAVSSQSYSVASPQTQVVASVAPTSSQACAPLQHTLTGQVITHFASAQPTEFIMEQRPVASVAPSTVSSTSQAWAQLHLPLTEQVITQSASVELPQFVMEQPPAAPSVAPSIVPPHSPQAGAPFQHSLDGQMITQPAGAEPPEFVWEQLPYASQSGIMASEDHGSISELDAQDVNDFYMGNINSGGESPESQSEPEMVTEEKAKDELKRSAQFGSVLALRPEWTKTLKVAHHKKSSFEVNNCKKKTKFTTQVKFIPKFDRTQPDSIHKFLLWSHIMMEKLEDANIKVRRRLKADEGECDLAAGDDYVNPEKMLDLSSEEETDGERSTAVKGTLNQAHEDMKAMAQTVAEKVFTEYRSMNKYTVAKNTGQSGKGAGKQGLVDKKVLGQLFHKSIGMVKYQSKRANVDADLIRKGVSWVKRSIRRMLEEERTGNGDWSRKEHQQRTEYHDLIRDEHQRWTDSFDWSRKEFADLQMHDRGQEQFFKDGRFSQDDYLDSGDDDRIRLSNFADGGTTELPKIRGKKRKRSRRGKSSSSKTKSHDFEKEGVDTKTKDQVNSGKKKRRRKKRKGGVKTEGNNGNTFEQEQDGISEGDLSGDGSPCEFDMDDVR